MMIPKLGLLARRRSSKGTHKELLVIFLLLCQTSRATQPSQKLIGTSAGDVTIGALFPVHEAPDSENAQSRICGRIREQYGIHRVEAAFQVLDEINNNQELLPNITLGIEIRDSCWYPPKALEQSIEFIRDTIAMRDDANGTSGTSPTGEKCTRGTKNTKNIVGIIGPGSSAVTIQVQNLLQLFNIPQIGYSATSRELSRKDFYKYFLRVVPSDEFQSKLMVDVLLKLNWSYVITVNSEGNYGNSGMEVFHTRAKEAGICVATTAVINHNAPFAEYELLLKSLDEFPNAKVIVCFCEGYTVRSLLNATAEMGLTGKFVIFGSDGWSDRMDVVSNLENHAQGSISVRLHTNYDMEFDNYFFKLNPFNNTRNPWFREFWEDRFDCSFNTTRAAQGVRMCTGTEKLGQKGTYKQDTKLEFVKKSIYTMAHGLHNMHKHFCPNHTGLCSAMLPINGSILLQHLFQVRFQYGDDVHSNESRVFFMDNGDPPGHYDIMNFQKNGDKYDYVQVGAWNDGELNLSGNIQWNYNWNLSEDQTPVSICSMPCPKGQVKNVHSETLKCCWTCTECRKNEILVDEFTCKACALGFFPNDNLTDCEQIKIEHLHWDDSESIVATSIAVGGIVLTVLVMVVFLTNHNTPIVKSSTRELSYIIMLGMLFSHVTTFVLLAYPTCERCMAARLIPGLSFSIIYSALAIKNKRIADCFRRSHKMKMEKESSSHFTSLKQQLIGIGITIAIEGTCCFIFLTLEPPDAVLTYPDVSRVVIDCNTTTQGLLFPLAYPCGLLGVCTYFAFQTRNIPGNFSEAKLIGFTVYTTIVIWIAFVAIYFGSKHKVISMCICTSLASLVCLIVLFMPRTYNILFERKSNVRSRFAATNPELRMHVGNSNVSRNSSTGDNNPSGRTHSTENRTNAPEQKGLTARFLRGLKCWSTKQDARELRRVQQADINRKARQLDMDQRARHRDHGDATSRPTPSAEEPSVGPSGYCGRKSSPDRQDPERERRVETGVQTTDDLLESLGPRLRKRIRSELDLHERPDLLNQECLHTERLTEVMETGWMSNPTRPHSRERGDYGTELAGVGEIYPEIIEDDDATLAGEDIEETQDEPSPVRGSCQPYGVIQRSRDGPSIIEESVSSNGDESSSGDYKRIIINIGLGGTRRGPGSGLVSGPGPVNAPRLREFPPVEEFPELPETPGINPVCPVHGNWAEVSAQELLHEYRDNQHHRGPRHDYHEHSHGGGEHGRHPPSRRRSSIWSCRNGCGHYHVRPHSHDRDGRDRYLPRRTGSRHDEPHRKGI